MIRNHLARHVRSFYSRHIAPALYRPGGILASIADASPGEVIDYRQVHPAYQDKLKLEEAGVSVLLDEPFPEDDGHQPETFTATLPGGSVCTTSEGDFGVVTRKGKLLGDISWSVNYTGHLSMKLNDLREHPLLKAASLPRRKRVSGALVVAYNQRPVDNYYHWFFDSFPHFYLLRKNGYCSAKYRYYMMPLRRPYEVESLRRLGIQPSQILEMPSNPFVKADELTVTQHPRRGRYFFKTWAMDFMKELFLPDRCPSKRVEGKPLVYITRNDGSVRTIQNENALLPRLKEWGFVTLSMSGMSLDEQAWLFNHAQVILAPHGAALASLAYCEPGTRVIELFADSYLKPYYAEIALRRELKYRFMLCPHCPDSKNPRQGDSMVVDLDELEALVRSCL
ncbi:glycosyltransferase family 61 protein [Ruficoccus sp. ZRK36]|uniref:glycosyltransferase family 61 protein n=1 Tax=Ruficoccus sp. ZRK36 TaxID=2866311 RepID=UPI001C72F353|nr:glycosyltransferase family 61 protein [Ruficoccus sp. ZRK36]QYY36946.1 glycosyltransferase family 61 protein [Ruficoccus sp. ZRK36]